MHLHWTILPKLLSVPVRSRRSQDLWRRSLLPVAWSWPAVVCNLVGCGPHPISCCCPRRCQSPRMQCAWDLVRVQSANLRWGQPLSPRELPVRVVVAVVPVAEEVEEGWVGNLLWCECFTSGAIEWIIINILKLNEQNLYIQIKTRTQ